MRNARRAIGPIVIGVAAIAIVVFVTQSKDNDTIDSVPESATSSSSVSNSSSVTIPEARSSSIAPAPTATDLPKSVSLDVPFSSQAPNANWDMPYQEACEETSLILVHYFLEQKGLTAASADSEILKVVDYEENELGFSPDVTMEQLGEIAEKLYGYKATVSYDISIDDIKKELAAGNPVIVPLAGRDLGNPYYSGEGPWYHALVITGYDSKNFITNDVGTKRGEGYKYPYNVLYDAIHDWTGVKEEIRTGRKAILIVTK